MSEKDLTHEIKKALRQKYAGDTMLRSQWVYIEELKVDPWYDSRQIDAWAINCFRSKDGIKIAFEIKVSKSDFINEIKTPEKREIAFMYSNEFYFVAPKGLLDKEEIPFACGLIEFDGEKFRKKKRAVYRQAYPPSWRMMLSMFRRFRDHSLGFEAAAMLKRYDKKEQCDCHNNKYDWQKCIKCETLPIIKKYEGY